MNVGILLNSSKAVDIPSLAEMTAILKDGGAHVLTDSETVCRICSEKVSSSRLYEQAELLIVFGGDGTLLSAAKCAAPHGAAVLGINLGRLGFLTEAEVSDLRQVACAILAGDYSVENRMMLTAAMPDGSRFTAMNDVVVSRNESLSIIRCDVSIDGRHFDSYGADGILAATPTGSTAYSLSCGGPAINPKLDCIVLSPICPHSFRARPMVLSPQEEVMLGVDFSSRSARVDIDGIYVGDIAPGEHVLVKKSGLSAKFARLRERSFYGVLRSKLMEQV
ncbi:MAG: NAD(+)/NADH kinase [Christensenellales bacterium]|jgi:NAD+ kinase